MSPYCYFHEDGYTLCIFAKSFLRVQPWPMYEVYTFEVCGWNPEKFKMFKKVDVTINIETESLFFCRHM